MRSHKHESASPTSSERGMATVEIALGMIPITVMIIVVLAAGSLVHSYLQAQDASRTIARSVALGEPPDVAHSTAARESNMTVAIETEGEYAKITVTAKPGGALAPLGSGPLGIDISATTVARLEPGVTLP